MLFKVEDLKNGCPKEIEKSIEEIERLSTKFLDRLHVYADQSFSEIKIEIQEAKDFLFQMIGRFVTLIADNYVEDEKTSLFEKGIRMKFEEDIGSILSGIRGKQSGGIEKLIGLTSVLRFAGDLKAVYDFIIYHPIIVANSKKDKDLKRYFENIFRTVRNNASVLGYAEKPTISIVPSKKIIPKSTDMIANLGGGNTENQEDSETEKELEALTKTEKEMEEVEDEED